MSVQILPLETVVEHCAIHEAGHVIVAVELEVPVKRLWLGLEQMGPGVAKARGTTTTTERNGLPPDRAGRFARIAVMMAGDAAQSVLDGRRDPDGYPRASKRDLLCAEKQFDALGMPEAERSDVLAREWARSRAIVEKRWRLVRRLADVLAGHVLPRGNAKSILYADQKVLYTMLSELYRAEAALEGCVRLGA